MSTTMRLLGCDLAKCKDLASAYYATESWQGESDGGAVRVVATEDRDATPRARWTVAIYCRDTRQPDEAWRFVARGQGATLEGARDRLRDEMRSLIRAGRAA